MISALENIWMQVQKPGRYTGGEVNSTVKDKSSVSVRFALCYPDLYEVGMSNLGIKILYELMNARPACRCTGWRARTPSHSSTLWASASSSSSTTPVSCR